MTYWEKILAAGLGMALLVSQTSYANTIIVPPMPFPAAGGAQTGTFVPGGNQTGSQNQAGPGVSGNQTGSQSQTGPGVSGNQAGSQSQTGSQNQNLPAPTIEAEGAVLIDGATGQVLFGKNQDTQFYPASITKVMTALLVLERCNLNDVVTFSSSATTNLESGAVSLGISEGDQLTVEQCLYGLLLKSANEIGNGLAEHVAGSVSGFADLMNKKARELGCKNTNFKNPHGLNDTEHKTTPYDMALILREALKNENFRKIDTATSYSFPAVKKAPAKTITMGHKMMYPTDSRYYRGIIGGKTGYTSKAGNTLVTGAERNGVQLIAVVMKAKGSHYTDTIAMLDYGFANYEKLTGKKPEGQTGPGVITQGTQETPSVQETPSMQETPSVQETPGATGPASETPGPAASFQGWHQDKNGWIYTKEDGKPASDEWMTINGAEYWFDGNGYMATGWRHYTDGSYYYFAPESGAMVSGQWVEDGGNWYYLSSSGSLFTNGTTPDGYPVNEYGIWVQ